MQFASSHTYSLTYCCQRHTHSLTHCCQRLQAVTLTLSHVIVSAWRTVQDVRARRARPTDQPADELSQIEHYCVQTDTPTMSESFMSRKKTTRSEKRRSTHFFLSYFKQCFKQTPDKLPIRFQSDWFCNTFSKLSKQLYSSAWMTGWGPFLAAFFERFCLTAAAAAHSNPARPIAKPVTATAFTTFCCALAACAGAVEGFNSVAWIQKNHSWASAARNMRRTDDFTPQTVEFATRTKDAFQKRRAL